MTRGVRGILAAGAVVFALVAYLLVRPDGGDGRRAPLTPTSTRADLSGVVLQGVQGTTTTTVPQNVGTVSFSGTVRTPEGEAVPGATVRAEWWRVDPPQVIEVFTNDQGQWELKDVAGGRWKVRAYRTPDYATGKVEQLFLAEDGQRQLDLEVRRVEGLSITWDIEPDPPITDVNAQLVVVFAERTVDLEGRAITTPLPDVPLTLSADAAWQRVGGDSSPIKNTDAGGRVSWVLKCRSDGQHDLAVSSVLGGRRLDLAACIPITSTSTTSTAPPPSETTTSTRGSGGGGGGGNRIEG